MFEMITIEIPWIIWYVTIPICVVHTLISSSVTIYKFLREMK